MCQIRLRQRSRISRLGSLLAGNKISREFEERPKDKKEIDKAERAILFVDEIHMTVGAGSTEGPLKAKLDSLRFEAENAEAYRQRIWGVLRRFYGRFALAKDLEAKNEST